MTTSAPSESQLFSQRIKIHSKFFYDKGKKFYIQGVNYGPFRPRDSTNSYFPLAEEVKNDFLLMQQAGINTVRTYHFPPCWLLDLAEEYGLKILVSIPWTERYHYFSDSQSFNAFKQWIIQKVKEYEGHRALLGYFVDNELPPDCIRFYGRKKIEKLISDLLLLIKDTDGEALVSYANFPPTEYFQPYPVDFYSFNVYLHNPKDLEAYLYKLQNLAGEKPLILSEFGMDSLRHGQNNQAWLLGEHIRIVFQSGLAGTIIFSWTDEWFTGGMDIEDWAFGLVTKNREPKKSYWIISKLFQGHHLPLYQRFPLERTPKVSVVVCSYNGANTLSDCLSSLRAIQYPDYEIIVVDDGSTDHTQEILKKFPEVIAVHQANKGLGVARNEGIKRASGEIVVFTDSDCMADPDWLYFLVKTLLDKQYVACGGPNYSPIPKGLLQAIISLAPGSPSHVLLTDSSAEHIPGCNMAFWKWIFEKVGYFDPTFRKAGDDVDFCWRILFNGYQIGFNPSAIVWHYRRFTIKEYLKQQIGYGEAEALLRFKHPHYFGALGSAIWKGQIYEQNFNLFSLRKSSIYQGIFGTGLFQFLYPGKENYWATLTRSFEYMMAASLLSLLLFTIERTRLWFFLPFLPPLWSALSYIAQLKADPKKLRFSSKLLLFFLVVIQPIVRGITRHKQWFFSRKLPVAFPGDSTPLIPIIFTIQTPLILSYWSKTGQDRISLLKKIIEKLDEKACRYALDSGWDSWDIFLYADNFWDCSLLSLTEIYPRNERIIKIKLDAKPTSLHKLIFFVMLLTTCFLWVGVGQTSLLATLPLLALLSFYLRIKQRRLFIKLIALIDQAAKEALLTKIK